MMYLIPAPAKLERKEGVFLFTCETFLTVTPGCSLLVEKQAGLWNEKVEKALGYRAALVKGRARQNDIVICQDDSMKEQSYILDICEEGITLTGGEKGLWHGMQTLLQMIEQEGAVIPAMHVEDAPDLLNRGYYFDCARGRVPKLAWLKELADRMAYYKLNQLQLYVEHSYLFRGMSELWRDDTPLSAEEIIELDHYCMDRGIELVPSLSSFGHLYKLLSTKEYAHLCEFENSDKQPFSLRGRMHHHTINTADPKGLALIKEMIGEYMELFTSRQFNICADETFDLGQGKSKALVEEKGKDWVYIGYVKALADFLLENGRRPMFWGDIIWGFPEMIKELPKETICLNWGYLWNQREEETKVMFEAGATQYCCPGCCSWNHMVPLNWYAYNNIMRLCTYAMKYHAIGLLNTDWGDFLHVNSPDFTRVGMIYGAAFSWNTDIPSYEEINRQISRVEFKDESENLLAIIGKVQENYAFGWEEACRYMELKKGFEEYIENHTEALWGLLPNLKDVDEKNRHLEAIERELYAQIKYLDSRTRALVWPYTVAVQGIRLFNEVGKAAASRDFASLLGEHNITFEQMPDCWQLAKELETWLYHYKKMYRAISKESELRRIEELVCWYGDWLRE